MTLLREQVATLESYVSAVRDGDPEPIHQARVATRRVRELLPLTANGRRIDTADELADEFRSIGRALGDVRDADVQTALMESLEARIPDSYPPGSDRGQLDLVARVAVARLQAIGTL